VLETRSISRRFGRTLALDRVDFHARPGEIHALIGENGAGKSTLVGIIAGRLAADSGQVLLDGVALRAGVSAVALRRARIAAVYQSPMLFERMTWEENLALGGFAAGASPRALDAVAARARQIAAAAGFELPPPRALVADRSVAERVRLEIVRALSFAPRVLILDEPTSLLAPAELKIFLAALGRLRDAGRIVVLVTHKLAEALAVADRITVMRCGRVVTETRAAESGAAELARLMIGALPDAPARAPRDPDPAAPPALALTGVTLVREGRRVLDEISLTVRPGEIVGLAGVDGNGQAELVEAIAGAVKLDAGSIVPAPGGPAVAVIPQHRDRDGLVLEMPLWENLMLAAPLRARFAPHGFFGRAAARRFCAELLGRFAIRAAAGPACAAGALSGGNRQRLSVARALAGAPRVIVAHDICRGLDLGAAAQVRRALAEFAAAGGAVLLISTDLDELLECCGRLLVMVRGRVRETAPADRDPERLGLLMAGAAA
jgi:simple sugar transport system ATP-binding protein